MIHLLRRSRLLALALLLATPALGGAWLQSVHPCPVDSPWLTAEHQEHTGHGQEAGTAACHCVGSCQAVAVAALVAAPVLPLVAAPVPVVPLRFSPAEHPPAARPSDRLPPATAPPLV
ncbi:MAG TPA: hypothetical protein VFT84_09395 [Gemmatimonadales bacterium]|nr:hypothetical protein [Gemmatimonadales bacterium]